MDLNCWMSDGWIKLNPSSSLLAEKQVKETDIRGTFQRNHTQRPGLRKISITIFLLKDREWTRMSLQLIFSNYWMRLSRIWRILQVEESVIHLGLRPRWITLSEICRILHILRKPNSIIALLFIQNIFFAQTCKLYSQPFLSLLNDTTLCPSFLGQWFNNCWRQWFNNLQRAALLTSLVQYD